MVNEDGENMRGLNEIRKGQSTGQCRGYFVSNLNVRS